MCLGLMRILTDNERKEIFIFSIETLIVDSFDIFYFTLSQTGSVFLRRRRVFIKIISHYKKIGYNINVLQQTACLVVNPITVGNFAFLFNCTPVGRTSDSMMVPT